MSNTNHLEATIPSECHGQRLDAVLASLFPDYSRSQLSKWIKDGLVLLNQNPCKPKDKVAYGDLIHLIITESNHPVTEQLIAQDIPLDIVYEDEDILVINKPAGLVVHPGAGNYDMTLVNALLFHSSQLQKLPRAGIIHRLDKDTTGLMIVAKTQAAYTELVRQMQAREIHRHYQALVQGYLVSGDVIETFFGRHPRNRLKMAVCTQGREAITHYSIHRHFNDYTLLDIQLMTGRTHQIRVHMAHINHPVVGDQLYGGRVKYPKNVTPELRQTLENFKRQALHACKLSLVHPINQEELTFHAPLPDDFKLLLKSIEEHDEMLES